MATNPFSYEQFVPDENRNLKSRFISEISDVFKQLTTREQALRRREKIRKDLVRVHFETQPLEKESDRSAMFNQIGKLLKLD